MNVYVPLALVLTLFAQGQAVFARPALQSPSTKPGEAPPPPPGTERVLSFDWHGNRVAACAVEPGGDILIGARRVLRTQVWIADPKLVTKTSMPAGTCDPAWSPDGRRLAV